MAQNTMGHLRSDIKRSEGVLQKLVNADSPLSLDGCKLTDPGKEWVIGAFDPFHDRELDITGFPDALGSNSLCQVITQSLQISAPASIVTSGETWDCHVVDFPFLGPGGAKAGCFSWTTTLPNNNNVVANTFFEGVLNNNGSFGGLSVYTFASSDNNVDIFTGNVLSHANLTPAAADLTNPYRVVASGFEVYNTSPVLYQSGACAIYSQPVADYNVAPAATLVAQTTPPAVGSASVNLMDAPPSSVSEALRLPNSTQWEAKEGCYVINKLHKNDLPPHLGNWTAPMYYQNTPADGTMYGPGVLTSTWITGASPISIIQAIDYNWTNFDQGGAIFTGLSPQSTLTINKRWIVEVFPTTSNALANFAKPSPAYDPCSLKLYHELAYKAPGGVEVKYNGLGDWFMDGIKSVASVVGPATQALAKFIPHKGLQAVAAATKAFSPPNKKNASKASVEAIKQKEKLDAAEIRALTSEIKAKKPRATKRSS